MDNGQWANGNGHFSFRMRSTTYWFPAGAIPNPQLKFGISVYSVILPLLTPLLAPTFDSFLPLQLRINPELCGASATLAQDAFSFIFILEIHVFLMYRRNLISSWFISRCCSRPFHRGSFEHMVLSSSIFNGGHQAVLMLLFNPHLFDIWLIQMIRAIRIIRMIRLI